MEAALETSQFCTMIDVDESDGEMCWAEKALAVLSGPLKVESRESWNWDVWYTVLELSLTFKKLTILPFLSL